MGKTILVSDRVNSFFTNNKIQAGTEIPTSGSYIKGDIIVNVGPNSASEPMWVCTEDGNPGTWGLVGLGGGGSFISVNESVIVNTAVTEVSLGSLAGVVSPKDKLLVHYNSAYLMEGVDYRLSDDFTKIIKLGGGTWNSNNDPDSIFTFELLKSVESIDGETIKIDSKLVTKVNNVVVTSPVNEVEIGIAGYNPNNDMLMVFKNSTFIVEGVDYTVNGNKIVSTGETWNSGSSANYSFAFVVFKEVAAINPDAIVGTENIINGSVTMDKVSDDVKQAIENASNIDLSGYQEKTDNSLVTTDKTIVGAINELFQNANNGKELIATAIGEPLNSSDTFSAMSNGIISLNSQFKTALMNNGVSVESTDKFKQLIEKLALLADSEGKGIKYASGNTGSCEVPASASYVKRITLNTNIEFTPTIFIIELTTYTSIASYPTDMITKVDGLVNTTESKYVRAFVVNGCVSVYYNPSDDSLYTAYSNTNIKAEFKDINWYAIGVGEEDTTLEDSLRSILSSKGLSVTEEDNLASLIAKVDSIPLAQGNAVEANVLSGKTFTNADGTLRTGSMVNNGSKTFTPAKSSQTGSAGYYSGITVSGDSNLVAANIISGKTIFGVNGTAKKQIETVAGDTNVIFIGGDSYYADSVKHSETQILKTYYMPIVGSIRFTISVNYTSSSKQLVLAHLRNGTEIWVSSILNPNGSTNDGRKIVDISNIQFGDVLRLEYRTTGKGGGGKLDLKNINFKCK